jgi:hypothetical protein
MRKRLHLGLIGLALCAATGAEAAETWLKDPVTGCGIWSDDDKIKRVASWSGACSNGKAIGAGVLVVVADGEFEIRYSGSMADGKAHGLGLVHYRAGDGFASYAGEFANSELHGRGFADLPDGSHYEGEFANDEPHGFGTHTASDGARYQGEFRNGKASGKGTYTAANGDMYLGSFINDNPDGELVLVRTDGTKVIQNWKNGELVK